jgi:hypothetical protein
MRSSFVHDSRIGKKSNRFSALVLTSIANPSRTLLINHALFDSLGLVESRLTGSLQGVAN